MKMRVLRVETEEQKAVARQLAPGRVFASGRAFTPFARTAVFSQLVELAGDSSDPSTKGSTSGKPGAVASNGSAASGDQGSGPEGQPTMRQLDRKAGTKSALGARCSRPSGSRTGGGKASSSASTPMRFRSIGATSNTTNELARNISAQIAKRATSAKTHRR